MASGDLSLRPGRLKTKWPCFPQAVQNEPRQTGKAGLVSRLGRGAGSGAVAASPAGGVSADHRLVSARVQGTGLAGERGFGPAVHGDGGTGTAAVGREAVLVAHAVLADGRREVLAVALGSRESTRAWTALLEDLKQRGLPAPLLIITDGGGGLLAAVEASFPDVPRQHCTKHKLANVLEKVPKGAQAEVGDAARRVWSAPTREQAEEALALFERAYQKRFPSAVECLHRDLEACWTDSQFPLAHWKRIRTTNVLERSFREVRRRVREVGRFQDERRALAMVHALLQEAQVGWQRLSMTSDAQRILATMRAHQQVEAA